jgi:hypothetical protein
MTGAQSPGRSGDPTVEQSHGSVLRYLHLRCCSNFVAIDEVSNCLAGAISSKLENAHPTFRRPNWLAASTSGANVLEALASPKMRVLMRSDLLEVWRNDGQGSLF